MNKIRHKIKEIFLYFLIAMLLSILLSCSSLFTKLDPMVDGIASSFSALIEAIEPVLVVGAIVQIYYIKYEEWPRNIDEVIYLADKEEVPINIDRFESLDILKGSTGDFILEFEMTSYLTTNVLVEQVSGRLQIEIPQTDSLTSELFIDCANLRIDNFAIYFDKKDNNQRSSSLLLKDLRFNMNMGIVDSLRSNRIHRNSLK